MEKIRNQKKQEFEKSRKSEKVKIQKKQETRKGDLKKN